MTWRGWVCIGAALVSGCGCQRARTDEVNAGPVEPQRPALDSGVEAIPSEADSNRGLAPAVADAGVVRFIAVGDTGRGSPEQRQVGRAMASVCVASGCDFVVLLGDNFYPSGVSGIDDPQWQSAFVEPYAEVPAPFYAVLGNHDSGGNGAGNELSRSLNQVAYSAVNPKWRMPATHYRWRFGQVDFFAADTNRSMFSLDEAVRRDFSKWFEGSNARWKIAFGHHPLRSNGPHGNAGSYDGFSSVPLVNGSGVRDFLESEVCGRAHVYLCGHDHVLEWLKPTCTRPGSTVETELLVSGGGSSTTGFPNGEVNPVHWHAAQRGFVYVVIDGDTFTGTFYDDSGARLFQRSVQRR